MYYSKALSYEMKQNESEIKYYKDSIAAVTNKLIEADHFSIENNEFAKDYFINYDFQKLPTQIKEALLSNNDDPNGNKYTGQKQLGNRKFIIDKIKILNHRWIIAEFNDGVNRGAVVLKYIVENEGKITFQIIDTIDYQKK
jgi:hypothetical protein